MRSAVGGEALVRALGRAPRALAPRSAQVARAPCVVRDKCVLSISGADGVCC